MTNVMVWTVLREYVTHLALAVGDRARGEHAGETYGAALEITRAMPVEVVSVMTARNADSTR